MGNVREAQQPTIIALVNVGMMHIMSLMADDETRAATGYLTHYSQVSRFKADDEKYTRDKYCLLFQYWHLHVLHYTQKLGRVYSYTCVRRNSLFIIPSSYGQRTSI